MQPSLINILDFLTELVDSGLGYSALNTARSALSACVINHSSVGNHPLVRRFMKGVFEMRPALPRYQSIWDPAIVLNYLESLFPLDNISLKDLTLKLCTLIALCTGQRCQSIHFMDIACMTVTKTTYSFVIKELVKTSKPGKDQPVLILPYFDNVKLCVATTLNEYIKRTKILRNSTKLFVSYCKPHEPVGKDTISRWVRTMLCMAGVNTELFKAHSTRAAATSTANVKHIPITSIMKAAHWSNDCTFRKFYSLPVNNDSSFAECILGK